MQVRLFFILLFVVYLNPAESQERHQPLLQDRQVIWGQGYNKNILQRFLPSHSSVIPSDVWAHSLRPSGLQVRFKTNASQITVFLTRDGGEQTGSDWNTKMSFNGLDLYAKNSGGEWMYAYPDIYDFSLYFNFPISPDDTNYSSTGYEYCLYLPVYCKLSDLYITVNPTAFFEFIPVPEEKKPIVLYGTSIIHGIAAGKAGNTWANILSRKLFDTPIINLGFSSSGRMEPEVINCINEIDAQVFVLDCLPNLTNSAVRPQIESRFEYAIKTLKESHPNAAILITEHLGFADMMTNKTKRQLVLDTNNRLKAIYNNASLKYNNIYYLSMEEIGLNMVEDMSDHIHPNDKGMHKYADSYYNKLTQILNILSSTQNTKYDNKLSVYPNPALNEIHIKTTETIKRIELLTQESKLMKSIEGNVSMINTTDICSGIYFLKFYLKNSAETHKIIIK